MQHQERQAGLIDIVMPAFNEVACIRQTVEALFDAVADLPYRFELIVVDDGSTDGTVAVAEELERRFPVRVVRLTRNFGKETALLAGLDCAHGSATIIMDADLQHPVSAIETFLERWREGYDCVYAVRRDREDESVLKRLLTRMFYFGVNRGSAVRIPQDALDFRLLDRAAVRALCSLRERVRFTKGLYAWLGFRSIAVPVAPAPRHAGETRFSLKALMRLGWDGMTSFSDWPLRLAGSAGCLVASLSIAYAIFIAVRTLALGVDVPGWATLTDAVCFVGGLQLLFLGILGQYVRSIFIESKHRPNYLVRDFSQSALCTGQRAGETVRSTTAGTQGPTLIRDDPAVIEVIHAA